VAVRRSLAWMTFGQGSFFILQFAGSIAIARLLSPYDVGIFSVAMAVVGLVSVVQTLGLNSYLIREPDLNADVIASAAAVNLLTAVVLALVIAAIGFVGAHFFREPGVRDVLLVVAAVPLIGHLAFVPGALLEREGDFKTLAMLKAGSTAFGLALTIALALLGYRYMAFAYSQVAAAVVSNLALSLIARRHVTFRLSVSRWSSLWRFGLQIFATSGVNRIATRLQEIALGRLSGLEALGLFSRASSNHTMVWDSIHAVVGRVFLVDFAQRKRDGESLEAQYLRVLDGMTTLLWPTFVGAGILAGPLILTLYGEKWSGAALPFTFLCAASVILVSTTMAWEIFVVCKETALQVKLEVIRTTIGTALFVAGALHSLEAAAASRILDALLAQAMYRRHLARMTGAEPGKFFRVYARSGALTLFAVAPAFAVMIAHGFSPHVPLMQVASSVLGGVLLWIVALRWFNPAIFAEIGGLARRLPFAKAALR
jgi:O-antigen/teichoic acid export membrane protein